MNRLLTIVQIVCLLLVGTLIVEIALWGLWTDSATIVGVVVSALLAYAGLLSWVFLGDREAWPKRAFAWIWQSLFSSVPRILPAFLVLLVAAVGGGACLSSVWPVFLDGLITFNQKPIDEEVAITVWTDPRDMRVITTLDSRFTLPLSRTQADKPIFLTAESRRFKTESLLEVKPGTVSVPLVRRHTLLVEVTNSADTQFQKEGVLVVAREATLGGQPVEARTDDAGLVYFEAAKGSRWRMTILSKATYTSPLLDVNSIPFTFTADLARRDYWETQPTANRADVIATSLQAERLSPALVKSLAVVGRKVNASELNEHDPQLVAWIPQATRLLVRSGYITSHNDAFKIPSWVAYTIEGQSSDWPRNSRFSRDPDLPQAVAADVQDYIGSGYDRGHLVSQSDMRYKGRQAMVEANYLSVICPQTRFLNQKVWVKVEELGRKAADRYEKVYIFAGPAFVQQKATDQQLVIPFIGEGRVAVPTHCFRIHVARINDQWRALSFLVPNQPMLSEEIARYLVSIDEIESATGLDFFSSLPPVEGSERGSESSLELWQ